MSHRLMPKLQHFQRDYYLRRRRDIGLTQKKTKYSKYARCRVSKAALWPHAYVLLCSNNRVEYIYHDHVKVWYALNSTYLVFDFDGGTSFYKEQRYFILNFFMYESSFLYKTRIQVNDVVKFHSYYLSQALTSTFIVVV